MARQPIKFGTDGWRAVVADQYTFDNVRACAEGVARLLRGQGAGQGPVVIGYDTRFQSSAFAQATAEVLAMHGIHTVLADGPVPTPATCYNIVARKAVSGVIITASHNPPEWNGFKCRTSYGGSLPQEAIVALEQHIQAVADPTAVARMPIEEARRRGIVEMAGLRQAYLSHLNTALDLKTIRDSGLRIAVDPMHGAGGGCMPELLSGGKAHVVEIRGEPNPAFPGMHNPEPIRRNLDPLAQAVRSSRADVGIAFDGDADRLGVMDERGRFMTTLQVGALLAYLFLEFRKQRGPIVKALTTSSMLWRLGEKYNIPVRETRVGFQYIAPVLFSEPDWLLGLEESGGYAFRGFPPERDGILSGVLFLELMVRTGKSASQLLEQLFSVVGPHHYDRLDLTFPAEQRARIQQAVADAKPALVAGMRVEKRDTLDGVRFTLQGGGWLAIRFSGTEPLLRIYAEADTPQRVQEVLTAGRTLAGL
ncbi:MAG: phosphoglucomutase/phosphomannomutase family protein [Dehalococcoidia bacterium]|nr:phosphoglucomutase/phosphomannomutase family protein [Dehalococcoidia bacterium]